MTPKKIYIFSGLHRDNLQAGECFIAVTAVSQHAARKELKELGYVALFWMDTTLLRNADNSSTHNNMNTSHTCDQEKRSMILANDFLEYLLNTERDLAVRVRERYDMYLKSLPVPQLADGKIVIDGRYMIDSHEGNYRLYRIEGGTPSVIGIYQRPSSAIVDVIADSIRITHRHADTEDTVLEIQRLAAVCRDTLNGMTK